MLNRESLAGLGTRECIHHQAEHKFSKQWENLKISYVWT